MELLRGRDVKIEKARQRQIDLLDLVDRKLLDDAGKLLKLIRLKCHRCIGTKPRPFLTREDAIRRVGHAFEAHLLACL
jgi:hypothetical protein